MHPDPNPTLPATTDWWRDAVIYQIYIRSFADGNGDGVGDLAGIRSRLPYLADLGVDGVWITPFYPSPMADGGYDVADYRAVDPLFGDLDDVRELLRRGLVDGVAHVVSADPQRDGRFFRYRIARTEDDVRAGAKSRYYPVELSHALETICSEPGRYAVTGVPCFVKAVQLLRREDALVRERVHAAALAVPRVREVHNVAVLHVGSRTELSLHLKLPGDMSLEDAHEVAEQVERAICRDVPEGDAVQTHLEPLAEAAAGTEVRRDPASIARIVERATGRAPREVRFLDTVDGVVAFLTLGLEPNATLAEAHARASEIEERIRRARPDIADVIVHTEP